MPSYSSNTNSAGYGYNYGRNNTPQTGNARQGYQNRQPYNQNTNRQMMNTARQGAQSNMSSNTMAQAYQNRMMQNQMQQGYQNNMMQNQMPQGYPSSMMRNQMQQGYPNNMMQNQMPQGYPSSMMQNQMPQGYPSDMMQNQMPQGIQNNMTANRSYQGQGSSQYASQGQPMTGGQQTQNKPPYNKPMSKPLPDGVRMEPLDENTLMLVKGLRPDLNVVPAAIEPVSNTQPSSNENAMDNIINNNNNNTAGSIIDSSNSNINFINQNNQLNQNTSMDISNTAPILSKLEEFIQNERNASVFYSILADNAPKDSYKRILKDLSGESTVRNAYFTDIYKNYNSQGFSAVKSEVHSNIPFGDGIEIAIMEESKSLRNLSSLLESLHDEKLARGINCMIYKKCADLSLLHMMNLRK